MAVFKNYVYLLSKFKLPQSRISVGLNTNLLQVCTYNQAHSLQYKLIALNVPTVTNTLFQTSSGKGHFPCPVCYFGAA